MNGGTREAWGRRRLVPILALAVLAAGVAWWAAWRTAPQVDPPHAAVSTRSARPAPPRVETPREVVDHPVAAAAAALLGEEGTAEEDLEIVGLVLAEYRKALGGNPVGENEEIVEALRGGNPSGLRFLAPDHPAVDPAGRLCDRWGTPLFFHALSSRSMEVVSAGPDRLQGTPDDLTRRE